MATFNIASYLAGVGDRHLDNFLLDQSDGSVVGIDFGVGTVGADAEVGFVAGELAVGTVEMLNTALAFLGSGRYGMYALSFVFLSSFSHAALS